MNINKALKQKNKLAGSISDNWNKIVSNNSYREDLASTYDVKKMFDETIELIDQLVLTKTNIAKANTAVYDKIFRMAELKSAIANIKVIPARVQKVLNGYGDNAREITHLVTLSQTFLDEKVEAYEKEIEALQEELDKYNFTTEI